MYLLDTNVISELRKAKTGKADAKVTAWARRIASASLFVSAISVLELEIGVLRMERRNPTQGSILRAWLDGHVLPAFLGRVLNLDIAVARCCAKLHVPDPSSDRDAIIAATAKVHGLRVVTRNIQDFAGMDVDLINPWVPPETM